MRETNFCHYHLELMYILIYILQADKDFVERHSESLSKLCFYLLNMLMKLTKNITPKIEKHLK